MRHYCSLLLQAILAGICITLGGAVFLNIESKMIGSVLFTLGLFTICTRGYALYTGKVSYCLDHKPSYILDVITIWVGNFFGTFFGAFCFLHTRIAPTIVAKAESLCEAKLADGYLSLFILGIFCNMLIYIAVDGFKKIPHEVGKYIGLFLGVIVFILCGFEHSIADMFYFSVAGWSVKAWIAVLVITAGNAVGGMLLPALDKVVAWINEK